MSSNEVAPDRHRWQAAIHSKLQEIHQHLTATSATADDLPGPSAAAHHAKAAGDCQTG